MKSNHFNRRIRNQVKAKLKRSAVGRKFFSKRFPLLGNPSVIIENRNFIAKDFQSKNTALL
ncbi:hypothetical protein BH11BAC3_BH11BAC3_46840 [soil metagenome]